MAPTHFKLHTLILAGLLLGACRQRQSPPQVADTAASINAPPEDPGPDAAADSLLVDVRSVDSTIRVDARYAGTNNFTGARLPGYDAPRALARREVVAALGRVQTRLRTGGLGLLIFDGYRPVRATLAMVDWAERTGRADLLDGYIARRSRHNQGVAEPRSIPFPTRPIRPTRPGARFAIARFWSGSWSRRALPTTRRNGGISATRYRTHCLSIR